MSTAPLTILQRIGNVISTLILGESKQVLLELRKDVQYIRKELDEELKPTLKEANEKVIVLWAERVAQSNSPIQLNPRGKDILEHSGIKEMIDARHIDAIEQVVSRQPKNAYWVQRDAKDVMFGYKSNVHVMEQLEVGAYKTGVDVDTVLFVGSLYLRDLVLKDLGFDHAPTQPHHPQPAH